MTEIIIENNDETNEHNNYEPEILYMELNHNIKEIFEKYINYLYCVFTPDINFSRFNDFYIHANFEISPTWPNFEKLLSFFTESKHYSHLTTDRIQDIIFLTTCDNEFNEFVDRLVEEIKEKERINNILIK